VVPDGAATVEAVGGYVNFRLTAAWLQQLVAEVTGHRSDLRPRPDIGRGRAAAGGVREHQPNRGRCTSATAGERSSATRSAGCSSFTNHDVQAAEYYVNSDNTQTRRFGASVYARLHSEETAGGAAIRADT